MVEAVTQGECTACGESDENYKVEARTVRSEEKEIVRELRCDCGERAAVAITEEGIESTDGITHESATWNQEGDE